MDYENYMELYEAIYFFDRINCCADNRPSQLKSIEEIKRSGLNESIYKAVIRILVVNNLLDYDGNRFVLTNENREKHQYILDNIINKNHNKHYAELFNKAVNESQFFFNSISESEYEIYSRYNFQITFATGKTVTEHVDFANRKVLEIGGSSGGLGTAILTKYKDCRYTIVDTKIPCMVGNEISKLNNVNIAFIEGNAFELKLPGDLFDYVMLMNFLHDFDDSKCLNVLSNCTRNCGSNTRFLVIEDALTGEFEPKEVVMHGLRLSVECTGGKQRTIKELASLFSNINYSLEKTIKLDNIHSMLVMHT